MKKLKLSINDPPPEIPGLAKTRLLSRSVHMGLFISSLIPTHPLPSLPGLEKGLQPGHSLAAYSGCYIKPCPSRSRIRPFLISLQQGSDNVPSWQALGHVPAGSGCCYQGLQPPWGHLLLFPLRPGQWHWNLPYRKSFAHFIRGQLPDSWGKPDGPGTGDACVWHVQVPRSVFPSWSSAACPLLSLPPPRLPSPFSFLALGSESSSIWLQQAKAFPGWWPAASQFQNSGLDSSLIDSGL